MAKGRIEANDIISKEALASIDQLGLKLKLNLDQLDQMIAKGKGMDKALSGSLTMNELNKTIQDQIKNLLELDAAKKKAEGTNENLKKAQKELIIANIQENQARRELKQTMEAEAVIQNKEAGTLQKLTAFNKQLTIEKKKLNLETVDGVKRLNEINAQLDKNNQLMKDSASAAEKQRMNIGNYASALDGLPGPLGAASGAGQKFVGVLDIIKKHPIIFAISLIVAAFAGLVKIFKSTEEGGDKIAVIMGKLKGILDVLKIAAQSVALAFVDLLSGKLGKAAEHMKEGFGGMGERMKDAAKAGGELAKSLDDIADEKLAYNIDAIREKIAQLRTEAAETTDPGERAAKLREAIALTKEMYDKQIDWSKRAADAEVTNVTAKFKITKEQLTAFLLADEKGRQEQIKGNQSLGTLANSINNENLAVLRDKLTEESKLNKEFNQETLRLRKTAAAGEESDRKEAAAASKQRLEDAKKDEEEKQKAIKEAIDKAKADREDAALLETSFINKQRDEDLTGLNQLYLAGQISTEKYEAEKNRITEYYADESLKNYLENLEIEIKAGGLTLGKEAEMLAKAAEIKKQITDKQLKEKYDAQKYWDDLEMADAEASEKALDEMRKDREEKEKKEAENKKDIKEKTEQAIWDLTAEAGNAIFEMNNNRIDAEIAAIEKKRDAEIKAAGDNKDAQKIINARYDKEVSAQKKKQAENDKLAALFNIAISTAMAVVKAAPNPVLMALAGAMGIIQAAVVMSKKIPEFRIGTKDSPGGPAWVGEEGSELMIDTYGGVQLSPERKSLVYLKPHTQIIPAKETDLLMRKAVLNSQPERSVVNVDMSPVVEAIKNKRENTFVFKDDGIDITQRDGDYFTHYRNNFKI